MRRTAAPPRAAALLVRLAVRDATARAAVLGDLHEEYIDAVARTGRVRAGIAFWRSAASVLGSYRRRHITTESGSTGMSTLLSDTRYAVRQLRRNAGFSLIAVLTLGLGIGAAVVIFSIARTVILRPLPFRDAERLVRLQEMNPEGYPFSLSESNFVDFAERSRSFSAMAAFSVRRMPLIGQGEPIQIQGMVVSQGFFETLGLSAVLGRTFAAGDFPAASEGDLAVLGHALWERMFGADPGVIGRVINVDGTPRTIIGVAPSTLDRSFFADVWVPFGPDPAYPRDEHRVEAIGKLRAGTSIEDARADLGTVAEALGEVHPTTNAGWGIRIRTFREWMIGPRPARVVGVLFGAVMLLLLLACVSVSNLLIARSTTRQREIAVRTALGAGRSRVVRQFLLESLLLSLIGAVIGLGLAYASVPTIGRLNSDALPRLSEIGTDPGAIAFACLLAVLTTLLFGTGPALHSTGRIQLATGLQGGARVVTRGTRRLRDTLVAGQLALALILLVGAGLLGGSFLRLARVDPGFSTEHVVTVRIAPRADRFPASSPAIFGYYRDLEARIEALPGVIAAGASMVEPFAGMRPANRVGPESATESSDMVDIQFRAVTPGFFRALAIPLLRGRYLEAADNDMNGMIAAEQEGREALINVLVSASLAERLWPGSDPVGKRLVWGNPGATPMTVVGVVAEVRDISLANSAEPMAWLPNGLVGWPEMTLMVRTAGDPAALAGPIREAIWSVDPDTPVPAMRALRENLDFELSGSRLNVQIIAIFAAAALLLATLGLYGVVAFTVAQRTRELGIRIALGAQPRSVLGLVMRQGSSLIVAGLVLGTLGALALSRFMTSILFEITPTHPATYFAVACLLAAIAWIASWVPARRAVRVDPRIALNSQ